MPPLNSDKIEFMRGMVVLDSASGLNKPTTGLVEQELDRVTIPARLLLRQDVHSVECAFEIEGAANTNSKSVRCRLLSLAGAVLNSHIGDAASANAFDLGNVFIPAGVDRTIGRGWTLRQSGSSFFFARGALAMTFADDIPVLLTGETPTAAGDLILRARRLVAHLNR